MTIKFDCRNKLHIIAMAPVTTMEELPVLSEKERAGLLASLKNAEAEIRSGNGIDYEPQSFKERLVGIYRGKKR